MQGISKRFAAVRALDRVHLDVRRGSVHALIGENGAGKSTLMKILSGNFLPDEGTMLLDGESYHPSGPKQARLAGISMIYQELTLAPHLSVEENVTLGVEKHFFGLLKHQDNDIKTALSLLGHPEINIKTTVRRLGIAQQQIVEIARSLLLHSRIIVMDEPTSSLSAEDAKKLFATIKNLSKKGITIIYISHFLEEIQDIAENYTVLRDGKSVATGAIKDITLSGIITHMVGRTLEEMFPRIPHNLGEVMLEVKDIARQPHLNKTCFQLHQGEIIGIAGLVGAGRTELLRSLFGLDSAKSGELRLNGKTIKCSDFSPQQALKSGLSMVSENRKEEGLATNLAIRDNISLSSLKNSANRAGILNLKKELKMVTKFADQIAIKYNQILDPLTFLSGGNQQKVALARVLADGNKILLLDEPTRGIDVKSKVEIYSLIGLCASRGYGIILVSSYLPELFGICDSLAVMYRGTLSPVKPISEWDEESVMSFATTGK